MEKVSAEKLNVCIEKDFLRADRDADYAAGQDAAVYSR